MLSNVFRRIALIVELLAIVAGRVAAEERLVVELSGRGLLADEPSAARVWAIAADEDRGAKVQRASPSGSASFDLTPGLWKIVVDSDKLWAEPNYVLLRPGDGEVRRRIVVWQAGHLRGGARLAANDDGIRELRLGFFRAPWEPTDASIPPEGETVCQVVDGAFDCKLPCGRYHLRLGGLGLIPHYLWNVPVSCQRPTAIGALRFQPGSSVAGWVELDDPENGPRAATQVTVELMTSAAETIYRRGSAPFRSRTNPYGFFHLESVPAGDYLLVASTAGGLRAQVPVSIVENRHALLREPIVVGQGESLEVFIDPPTAPDGSPWRITLLQRGARHVKDIDDAAPATADGYYKRDGLLPGRYVLVVSSPALGGVHEEELVVDEGPATKFVELALVELRGRLRLGSRGVRGDVFFGGSKGLVSRHFVTDAHGRFEGVLPRPGRWRVEVDTPDPRIHRFFHVDVEPNDSGIATLTIEIPNTRIEGVVVDEHGRPPERSFVAVWSLEASDEPVQELLDETAQFELVGLSSGLTKLFASAADPRTGLLESDEVIVNVQEDVELAPLRLVVRKSRRLSGQVVSEVGPVPNAFVMAIPAHEPDRPSGFRRTDADGYFDVPSLPARTTELFVAAGAMGYGFRIFRSSIGENDHLRVRLGLAAGTLVVDSKEGLAGPMSGSPGPFAYVGHRGAFLPVFLLREWAIANGGSHEGQRLTIPGIEPGDYSLCAVFLHEVRRLPLQSLPPDRCVDGTLYPDGQLRLVLPAPPQSVSKER